MSEDSLIRPFHCGSQFADWEDRNCNRCYKSATDTRRGTCSLQQRLGEAYWGNGTVTAKVAERIGLNDETKFAYTWDCPEREEKAPQRKRTPKKNSDQLLLL